MAETAREAAEAEALEAALKGQGPRDRELVQNVLENHPSLPVDEAIEMLKYFGGL